MKRIAILVPALMLVVLLAPLAQAQTCSGYHCKLGSCPWYELVVDGGFTNPSCGAWTYFNGGSRVSSGNICNSSSTSYGQLLYNGGLGHNAYFYQTFNTLNGSGDLDNYSLQYTIEITDLSPGDIVKVTITDITTGAVLTTDQFSADTWCDSVSHSWNSAGWKGHQLKLKFGTLLDSTTTRVKVTGVSFWQEVTY